MSRKIRILVVDGYSKSGRLDLEAGGATTAGKLYSQMLQRCSPGVHVDIMYPADPDVTLPSGASLEQYDGIAWTGSSLTIYKDDPMVASQVAFAKAAYRAGIPSFGSCWAAQIAVVAAGGTCALHPRGREMGVARKITLTPEGRAHPLYTDKKSVFDAFISHDDEITRLPSNAVLLASNGFTRVQAVSIKHQDGRFWALQYHPEYDLHELARLIHCRREKLTRMGFFADIDTVHHFVGLLEMLHEDPSRKDIAWQLGIDEDIMNDDIRTTEVRNWIDYLVIPSIRD